VKSAIRARKFTWKAHDRRQKDPFRICYEIISGYTSGDRNRAKTRSRCGACFPCVPCMSASHSQAFPAPLHQNLTLQHCVRDL
jgi:hypothetical protein